MEVAESCLGMLFFCRDREVGRTDGKERLRVILKENLFVAPTDLGKMFTFQQHNDYKYTARAILEWNWCSKKLSIQSDWDWAFSMGEGTTKNTAVTHHKSIQLEWSKARFYKVLFPCSSWHSSFPNLLQQSSESFTEALFILVKFN